MSRDGSLAHFFEGSRLIAIPRRLQPRRALLDLLARQFEPGRRYSEGEVNDVLAGFHPDYCALRRYLVDAELLDRRDGIYWRVGGTFDVD